MDSTHTPQIRLDSAANADGSVICTLYGTTVVATINGPLEVSRRDESTEEATLEVELRPSHGAAGNSWIQTLSSVRFDNYTADYPQHRNFDTWKMSSRRRCAK